MRSMLRATILGLFAAIAVSTAPASATDSSCEAADAMLGAHQLDLGQRIYAEGYKTDATATCARNGLAQIDTIRADANRALSSGQGLESVGLADDACAMYVEALRLDPSLKQARDRLDKLLATPVRNSTEAELEAIVTLARLGLREEARERLKVFLDKNPEIPISPTTAAHLRGVIEGLDAWQLWFEAFTRSPIPLLILLAIVLLIVLLPITMFWRRLKPIPNALYLLVSRGELTPRLSIEPFDKGATGLDIGNALAARIEDWLTDLNVRGTSPYVHLVSGPTVTFEVPTKVVFGSIINTVMQYFDFLGRRSQLKLTGHLHVPGDQGAGMTITLERGSGETLGSTTFWHYAYDPERRTGHAATAASAASTGTGQGTDGTNPGTFYHLSVLAAAWTLFQIGREWTNAVVQGSKDELPAPVDQTFRLLGTSSWESYTFYLAGVYWTLVDHERNARIQYVEALNRDPGNLAASINLGVLCLNEAVNRAHEPGQNEEVYALAKERLHAAIDEIQKRGEDAFDPALLYVARFQCAAAYEYCSRFHEPGSDAWQRDIEKATDISDDLKTRIDTLRKSVDERLSAGETPQSAWRRLVQRPSDPQQRYDANLKNYLESIRPMAHVMNAVHLSYTWNTGLDAEDAKKKQKRGSARKIVELIQPEHLSYRAHYNLACYYSVSAEFWSPDMADAKPVFDGITTPEQCYKKALRHLAEALLHGDDIVTWALSDPSLRGVRGDRPWKEGEAKTPGSITKQFRALIRRYQGSGQGSELPRPALAPPVTRRKRRTTKAVTPGS